MDKKWKWFPSMSEDQTEQLHLAIAKLRASLLKDSEGHPGRDGKVQYQAEEHVHGI